MNYSRTLSSIACLKVVMENGSNDFIDAYIPIMCELIRNNQFNGNDITLLCSKIKEEFGLSIPYHAMQSLLTRCKSKKIIKQKDGLVTANPENLWDKSYKLDMETETKVIHNLCKSFTIFATNNFNENYDEDKASNIIFNFLNNFDIELIIALSDNNGVPNFKIRNRDKYIFSQFVQESKANDVESFNSVMKLAIGNVFANMICYQNQDAFIGKLKGIVLYVDTPFLIKLSGIEGIEKEDAFRELVELIKHHGGRLAVFDHTNDEVDRIFEDCKSWIDNPCYNPELASDAIRYFVENHYTQDDVRLFVSKLSSTLRDMNIESHVYINPDEYKNYQVDDKKLFDIIYDCYYTSNYVYEYWKKHNVINKDVMSISNIYRLWSGNYPSSLQTAKALFLTTDGSLVKASEKFETSVLGNKPKVYPCYTDVFIGTMLWLQSPSKIESIQRKKMLSFCMSQIKPTQEVI